MSRRVRGDNEQPLAALLKSFVFHSFNQFIERGVVQNAIELGTIVVHDAYVFNHDVEDLPIGIHWMEFVSHWRFLTFGRNYFGIHFRIVLFSTFVQVHNLIAVSQFDLICVSFFEELLKRGDEFAVAYPGSGSSCFPALAWPSRRSRT